MYNIKLDENKYFTGSYAKVGKVNGGIDIETLPPEMDKAQYYKYDYYEEITVEQVPEIDEIGGFIKLDDDGNICYIDKASSKTILGWIFDADKYNEVVLNEVKTKKLKELSEVCETIIDNGTDINTNNGTEHFSFNEKNHDQSNIKSAYEVSKATGLSTLYHADGQFCRIFTVPEISHIYLSMLQYITYNTTLCNMLNTWVKRCTTIEEIESIQYNSILPSDIQVIMDDNMAHAQTIVTALNSN